MVKPLKFLSSRRNVERDGGEGGADLDEEMEKMFAPTETEEKFDLATISSDAPPDPSTKFNEKDFSFHRKKSYPHMHAPLKALHTRTNRKRSSTNLQTRLSVDESDQIPEQHRKESQATDSDTAQSIPNTLTSVAFSTSPEGDDGSTAEELPLSESEAIVSERAQAFDTNLLPSSPDRRVQFDIARARSVTQFTFPGSPDSDDNRLTETPEEGQEEDNNDKKTKRKHGRHHHHHHHRKYSMAEDPTWRKRSGAEALPRRMSEAVLEETANLQEADQDELVSHRFDENKWKRRYSVKPKEGGAHRKESQQLVGSVPKKLFDHSPHEVFVQLDELSGIGEEREWKETARWIKYEEDVEEGAERWGKPHVAPLSFHSLLNLRKCLETGVILLDLEEKELPGVVYRVVEQMVVEELIKTEDKPTVMRALLLRHRHVQEHERFRFNVRRNTSSYSSLQNLHEEHKKPRHVPSASIIEGKTSNLLQPPNMFNHTAVDMKEETYMSSNEDLARKAAKESILKRIPIGAEATTVLVGAVDFLEQATIAFIRLAEGILIPSITEVPIPVRFMFILLGPTDGELDYHEIGRSISTLMSNPEFHIIAYKASARKELLSAINEFLDCSIVLPPGNWERQALLPIRELKAKTEAIRRRQSKAQDVDKSKEKALLPGKDGDDEKKPPDDDPLRRTRRPWGGLINDIKRRYPLFRSDFMDGMNGQCFAAAIFMYFAALSGAITFGGLMADKTNNLVGISETLVSTSITGIVFALLSGQPLVIIGATGPLLLFDESLFTFCQESNIDYMTTRVYIGIWLAIISLVVSMFEGSVLVKLFTRFTEEIFASLISILYIVESIMKMYTVFEKHPLMTLPEYCAYANESSVEYNVAQPLVLAADYLTSNSSEGFDNGTDLELTNGTQSVAASGLFHHVLNEPNTALFCTILSLGTFFIAYYLRQFRNSKFLGRSARRALGDFGVPIAIVMMVTFDYFTPGTYTEKLKVPQGLSPSKPEERGWLIPPTGLLHHLPFWIPFAAVVPAMLVYILLFMETHISELIISKKERKLKKGSGFHLDIVLICLLNVFCGFLGAPFVCAATVRSVTHVSALTVLSRTHAPGDKPHIIEVKEQRVSALLVSVLVGVSVMMSPLLRMVPMSVLFGVFLYMGISSINGIQFFERCRLFFMPVKHYPQVAYVRRVTTLKMHLFTIIQLLCLTILWIVKSSEISLAFPFFLILMIPLRAQMRFLFDPSELRALDSDEPDAIDQEDEEPDFYQEALLPG